MDELDLLRRMGEQEPAVDAEARARAWERLHRHAHSPRQEGTPPDGQSPDGWSPQPQRAASWWMRLGEYALVVVGVVVLVAAVALLAHRPSSRPRPQSPPPRYHGVTYITSGGGIATGDYRIGGFREIVPNDLGVGVPNHRIVAFGWSPDGERIAYLTNSRTPESFETQLLGITGTLHDPGEGHRHQAHGRTCHVAPPHLPMQGR